ncbi:MAG: TrkH family potassium uptake protein [Firmicutes bacterium]|nr:TrkH family potassium uptake protein [Bacillota bacterium]
MNYKMVFYILKRFMWMTALLLVLPLGISLYFQEGNVWPFLIPIIGLFAISLLFGKKEPKNTTIYAKEGYLIVALAWIIISLVGALPYYFSDLGLSYLDCVFETVSGLTTTGSSILTDVEALSNGLLFWRSFTNWIGGMGVLVFLLAILPQTNSHSVHLMRAEMPGHQVGKLVSKVKHTVQILYSIYIVMTLILIVLLLLGKMPLFDSVVAAFATAGTGGFAIKNASIAFYNNVYIEIVIGIFMILFGVNFNLYFLILTSHALSALKSEELRWYLAIILVAVLLIASNIYSIYQNTGDALRYAFFQVSSIITTTGFATTNFNLWPNFSKALLVILMFVGAMAGSTGGGIKVSRIIILFKTGLRDFKRLLSPRSVKVIKFEKQSLDSELVSSISAYLIVFMLLFVASVLVIALDNIDLVTAFSAVAACINNIGPGLNGVGPVENFSKLSDISTLVLIFDMLAGRLELFPILMLFSPATWRRK